MNRILCVFLTVNLVFLFSACETKNTSSSVESLVTSATTSQAEMSSQTDAQSKKPPVQSETTSKTDLKASSSKVSSVKATTSTATSSVKPVIQNTTSSKSVSSKKTVSKKGATYTGLTSLSAIEYKVADPLNKRGLSTKSRGFSFGAAKDGKPHSITVDNQAYFDKVKSNALAWDNKSNEKVLYLTFDCGYPYKNLVPRILNTLNKKQVKQCNILNKHPPKPQE